jgi:hypothetical protein
MALEEDHVRPIRPGVLIVGRGLSIYLLNEMDTARLSSAPKFISTPQIGQCPASVRILGYVGCNLDHERLQTHFFGRDQHIPRVAPSQDARDLHFDRQRRICAMKRVFLLNLSTNPRTRLPYLKARQA